MLLRHLLALSFPLLSTASADPSPDLTLRALLTDGLPPPQNYGIVLFPAFQALDVFGPLDVLNTISNTIKLNLRILAATLDPVSTKPTRMNPAGSDFGESVVPTHTFADAPDDIEVLIVPGGIGTRGPQLVAPAIEYVEKVYPRLRYLVTVCTGSALVAQTGILDGRKATTNKNAWAWATAQGPRVDWVPKARWAVDGNVITSSGVAAGIDATFAFAAAVYGEEVADRTANAMEVIRVRDFDDDPFADYFNVTKPPVEPMPAPTGGAKVPRKPSGVYIGY